MGAMWKKVFQAEGSKGTKVRTEAGSVSAVSEQQQGGHCGLSRSSEGRVRTEEWQGADHLESGGYRIWAK